TVCSFTVGNPGAAGATGNVLSAPGPASWNRSLDRALDEATTTGCLNLSGRKLKEFPRSAAIHDLTDTTRAASRSHHSRGRGREALCGRGEPQACAAWEMSPLSSSPASQQWSVTSLEVRSEFEDLSRNRLSELPVEVCMYVSLENLNLYQNCLRSLPESLINLQALTYLNISRNQLCTLPAHVCSLPLKVLIACNNKLVSLPEELGHLRQLTELDVSCNEIQTLPSQVGQLEALRDLNIRRNHLVRLPPELAELPLVRLDFSCNKVTVIPVCYRNLRHLQSMVLDNNPLQSPPAQICIKGKIHIFKYLNMEACKITPDLPDYDRRPLGFGSCVEELYAGRPYGALDSGFNSVDSGDKRWSGNEVSSFFCQASPSDELSDLPLRVAEITKEQRRERDRKRDEHRTGSLQANGTLETELEQIDFIDSCTWEEEEEDIRPRTGDSVSLSSQFMAYIERRITREVRCFIWQVHQLSHVPPETRELMIQDAMPHHTVGMPVHTECRLQSMANTLPDPVSTLSPAHLQRALPGSAVGVERARREAQLAAQRYEEERQKARSMQKDTVRSYAKSKSAHSPTKLSPPDNEVNIFFKRTCSHALPHFPYISPHLPCVCVCLAISIHGLTLSSLLHQTLYPSRRSTHTDDSALFMGELEPLMVFEIDIDTNTIKKRPDPHKQSLSGKAVDGGVSPSTDPAPSCLFQQGEDRTSLSPAGESRSGRLEPEEAVPSPLVASGPIGEEAELVEQLRKNIESRLKVSLPSDLGAALTDGVVLCHLANHVRPRSVPSIHVPSPAVPKLTMAKCRRNVENFLEACRRIGVP
ncbi:hypothetical protein P4O66_018378, partial [Electrophorus voltai]